ncbi:MAG: hypothetical protein GY950_01455 [bacterium]|nr:hypothetical protein [bacterium]
MKNVPRVLFVLVFFSLVFSFAGGLYADKSETGKKTVYVCSMKKCDVKADKPGKCPKCGMELIKKVFETAFVCPVEKCGYKSEKPGKCPKCGKELKQHVHEVAYACPMKQCNVKANEPGKCPKCGMKLKKVDHHAHEKKGHVHKPGEKHTH